MPPFSLAPARSHTRVVTSGGVPVTTPAGPWLSGVYRGYVDSARITDIDGWATFQGSGAITSVTDFLNQSTFGYIAGQDTGQLNRLQTLYQRGVFINLSVPMLPDGDTTTNLAAGAAGAYNTYFNQLAVALNSRGMGGCGIRLGWEADGDYYRWCVNTNYASGNTNYSTSNSQSVTDWIGYWQQVVNTMRAVNPNFVFIYCPNNRGGAGRTFNCGQLCPPDPYVDHMAVDIYDFSNSYPPQDSSTWGPAWTLAKTGSYGLDYWTNRANVANKKFSVGEWGIWKRSDGHGGLDNPSFITNMHNYLLDTANLGIMGFANYFDNTAPDGDHRLYQGLNQTASQFPNSRNTYQSLTWGR